MSHPLASAHLQAQSDYNRDATPASQPTEMQAHVLRAEEIAKHLYGIHDSLRSVISRLFGESEVNTPSKDSPRAVGLSNELTGALSDIEWVADQIACVVTRLSLFA